MNKQISRSRILTYNEYSFAVYNKYSTFCRRILHFRSATERLFLFFHFYHFFYMYICIGPTSALLKKGPIYFVPSSYENTHFFDIHATNSKIRSMEKQSVL